MEHVSPDGSVVGTWVSFTSGKSIDVEESIETLASLFDAERKATPLDRRMR
jgi:hypothetical protein